MTDVQYVHDDDHQSEYVYASFDQRAIHGRPVGYSGVQTGQMSKVLYNRVKVVSDREYPLLEWTHRNRTVSWRGDRNRYHYPFAYTNPSVPGGNRVVPPGGPFIDLEGADSIFLAKDGYDGATAVNAVPALGTSIYYKKKTILAGMSVLGACVAKVGDATYIKAVGYTPYSAVIDEVNPKTIFYRIYRVSDGAQIFSETILDGTPATGVGLSSNPFFCFNLTGTEGVLDRDLITIDDDTGVFKISCPGIGSPTVSILPQESLPGYIAPSDEDGEETPYDEDTTSTDSGPGSGSSSVDGTRTTSSETIGYGYESQIVIQPLLISIGYNLNNEITCLWEKVERVTSTERNLSDVEDTATTWLSGQATLEIITRDLRQTAKVKRDVTQSFYLNDTQIFSGSGVYECTNTFILDNDSEASYDASYYVHSTQFNSLGREGTGAYNKLASIMDVDLRKGAVLFMEINNLSSSQSGIGSSSTTVDLNFVGDTNPPVVVDETYVHTTTKAPFDMEATLYVNGTLIPLGVMADPGSPYVPEQAGTSVDASFGYPPTTSAVPGASVPSGLYPVLLLGGSGNLEEVFGLADRKYFRGELCFDWKRKFYAISLFVPQELPGGFSPESKTLTIKESSGLIFDISGPYGLQASMSFS